MAETENSNDKGAASSSSISQKYVLSLDVGSTSVRCFIFRQDFSVVTHTQQEFRPTHPHTGWVEYDAKELFSHTCKIIQDALSAANLEAKDITSMGITNQRSTCVLWNKETGEPVTPLMSWSDHRAQPLCDRLNSSIKCSLIRWGATFLHAITRSSRFLAGSMFKLAPIQAMCRVKWAFESIPMVQKLSDEKKLLFGTIDTWLIWNLTGGAVHATDRSNMITTGFLDPFRQEVPNSLFSVLMLGLPWEGMLPELRDSCSDFGSTLPDLFGSSSIPIRGVVGDQSSSMLGHECYSPGEAKVTFGTGGFVNLNTGGVPLVSKHRLFPLVAWKLANQDPVFMLEGSTLCAGTLIDWGQQLGFYDKPEESEELALSVQDSNGVVVVPAINGGLTFPYWDTECRGVITGLTQSTRPPHIVRALLEATVFRVHDVITVVQNDTNAKFTSISCDGGLARNDFIMQFLADLLDIPLHRPKSVEQTVLGAAILAGIYESCIWKDFDEVRTIRAENEIQEFTPKMDADERQRLLKAWRSAVHASLNNKCFA